MDNNRRLLGYQKSGCKVDRANLRRDVLLANDYAREQERLEQARVASFPRPQDLPAPHQAAQQQSSLGPIVSDQYSQPLDPTPGPSRVSRRQLVQFQFAEAPDSPDPEPLAPLPGVNRLLLAQPIQFQFSEPPDLNSITGPYYTPTILGIRESSTLPPLNAGDGAISALSTTDRPQAAEPSRDGESSSYYRPPTPGFRVSSASNVHHSTSDASTTSIPHRTTEDSDSSSYYSFPTPSFSFRVSGTSGNHLPASNILTTTDTRNVFEDYTSDSEHNRIPPPSPRPSKAKLRRKQGPSQQPTSTPVDLHSNQPSEHSSRAKPYHQRGHSTTSPSLGHPEGRHSSASPAHHRRSPSNTSTETSRYASPSPTAPGYGSQTSMSGVTATRINNLVAGGQQPEEDSDSSLITPGLIKKLQPVTTRSLLPEDTIFCAIAESRKGDVIGLATINLTTGVAEITRILSDDQFEYQRLIAFLSKMEELPHCFVVPDTLVGKKNKGDMGKQKATPRVLDCLRAAYPQVHIEPLAREAWSEVAGLNMVRRLALDGEREAILSALEKNFYASCAFAAVIEIVTKQLKFNFAPDSMPIKYTQTDNTLRIDRVSVSALELLENTGEGSKKACTLFKHMDRTTTPQGRRLLRTTLLQPSTDRAEIIQRHEAVEEFTTKEEFLADVTRCLRALHRIDIERVVAWILRRPPNGGEYLEDTGSIYTRGGVAVACHEDLLAAEWELNYVLMLKEYLEGVAALHATLAAEGCTSRLGQLVEARCGPERLGTITDLLQERIDQNAGFSTNPITIRDNRTWALRAREDSALEQARQSYRDELNVLYEHMDEINAVLSDYIGEKGNPHMDSDRRFYLTFPVADVKRALDWAIGNQIEYQFEFRLPQQWAERFPGGDRVFIATRKKNLYSIYTRELFQMATQAQQYADMAIIASDKEVVTLRKTLQLMDLSPLFEVSDAVATLDLVCCFAHLSTAHNYTRPQISDQLVLQGARNPIVEKRSTFTPHDVYFGSDDHRGLIITGGNMAGKSTLVKMVGLIQIMAQMGCFVPADFASIEICHQVLTRLSTEDKPEENLGTFGVEMRDMNLILRQATNTSLVLIDELGRGTSHDDGLSLALAMSKKLLDQNVELVFATHFSEIGPALHGAGPEKISVVHFESNTRATGDSSAPEITLSHKLAAGPLKDDDYGVELARRFLPLSITNDASHISNAARGTKQSTTINPSASQTSRMTLGIAKVIESFANLLHIDSGAMATELIKLKEAAGKNWADSDNPAEVPEQTIPDRGDFIAESRARWAAEEMRVMQINMPAPTRKRARENDESTSEEEPADHPHKVFRGATGPRKVFRGASVMSIASITEGDSFSESSEDPELERLLDEARAKLRQWELEDGL